MSTPRRIRLQRTKGWSIKDQSTDYVIVDRRGAWGNPWTIHRSGKQWFVLRDTAWPALGTFDTQADAQTFAVGLFRRWLSDNDFAATLPNLAWGRTWILDHLGELAGKDLACWCREETACHAGVYFELLYPATGASQ